MASVMVSISVDFKVRIFDCSMSLAISIEALLRLIPPPLSRGCLKLNCKFRPKGSSSISIGSMPKSSKSDIGLLGLLHRLADFEQVAQAIASSL